MKPYIKGLLVLIIIFTCLLVFSLVWPTFSSSVANLIDSNVVSLPEERDPGNEGKKILILPNSQLILPPLCFVQAYTGTTLMHSPTALT